MVKKVKDFQKVKLKIGRKVKRQNETIVDVKSRKITLPQTKIVAAKSHNLCNILNQVIDSLNCADIDDICLNLENVYDIISIISTSKSSLKDLIGNDFGSFEFGDLFGYLLRFSRTIQSDKIPTIIKNICFSLSDTFLKENYGAPFFENILAISQIMISRNEKIWISEGLRLFSFLSKNPHRTHLIGSFLTSYEFFKNFTRIFQYFDQLIDSKFNVSCKLALVEASTRLLSEYNLDSSQLGSWFPSSQEVIESQTSLCERVTSLFRFHNSYTLRYLEEIREKCSFENICGLFWSVKGLNYLLRDYAHLLIPEEEYDRVVHLSFKRFPIDKTEIGQLTQDPELTNKSLFLVEMLNAEGFLLQNLFLSTLTTYQIDCIIDKAELALEKANSMDNSQISFLVKLAKIDSSLNKTTKKAQSKITQQLNQNLKRYKKNFHTQIETCPKKLAFIHDSWILALASSVGILERSKTDTRQQCRLVNSVLSPLVRLSTSSKLSQEQLQIMMTMARVYAQHPNDDDATQKSTINCLQDYIKEQGSEDLNGSHHASMSDLISLLSQNLLKINT